MGNPQFFTEYLNDAQKAAAQCPGMLVSVILAQWADETGYGSSQAFVAGNNYAGVSAGGGVNTFPSKAAGLDAYINTLNLPYYNTVRATVGWQAQCVALGQSPWAGSKYDANDYNAGLPLANPGIDLVNIVTENALTRYDTAPSAPSAAAQANPSSPSGGLVETFRSAYPQVAPPVPGFTSNIGTGDIVVNGTKLDLIVGATGQTPETANAVVTAQLDLAIDTASTMTLTIHDPERTIINSPVFAQASLIELPGSSTSAPVMFQLVSVQKQGSVLTTTFEAYVVAALRRQTGPFTIPPDTMTRTQFAELLVSEIEDASFLSPPVSYLYSLDAGYDHQNEEQLSRGTWNTPLEDSWTCLQRLANEIQWVCFETFNTVYFGPYSWLASLQPVMEPQEWQGGIDDIDGEWDVGQPLSQLEITAAADSWSALIGQSVAITNLGPFSTTVGGPYWIVSEMERDDLNEPDITITVMQPLPGLPEPSQGGERAAVGSGAATIQTQGGSQQAQAALAFCISKIGLPYIWGGTGPNGYDCSGLVYEAYLSQGIDITRTTYSQWPSAAGQSVPAGIANLRPGDLVYFASSLGQAPEHVAIVDSVNNTSGSVKLVQAPETGEDIGYSPMNPAIGANYGPTLVYIGALRPAP